MGGFLSVLCLQEPEVLSEQPNSTPLGVDTHTDLVPASAIFRLPLFEEGFRWGHFYGQFKSIPFTHPNQFP
ncbi:MAG: hypothetical protein ACK4WK_11835, partial [Anaerolineae bacterium]